MSKKKITISLSETSMKAMEELRERTDADTDSEVFRNALRLHLALVRAEAIGIKFYMKNRDEFSIVPVAMFLNGNLPERAIAEAEKHD